MSKNLEINEDILIQIKGALNDALFLSGDSREELKHITIIKGFNLSNFKSLCLCYYVLDLENQIDPFDENSFTYKAIKVFLQSENNLLDRYEDTNKQIKKMISQIVTENVKQTLKKEEYLKRDKEEENKILKELTKEIEKLGSEESKKLGLVKFLAELQSSNSTVLESYYTNTSLDSAEIMTLKFLIKIEIEKDPVFLDILETDMEEFRTVRIKRNKLLLNMNNIYNNLQNNA